MFNLVRRISHSLIPRPDRPWEDDPTSNAPAKRKKRRLSSTERDQEREEEEASRKKKHRGESLTPDAEEPPATPLLLPETQDVKDVTHGVEEVDLEDKQDTTAATAPESVPLPEEGSGELDEPAADTDADAPSPPEALPVVAESSSSTNRPSALTTEAEPEDATADETASAEKGDTGELNAADSAVEITAATEGEGAAADDPAAQIPQSKAEGDKD